MSAIEATLARWHGFMEGAEPDPSGLDEILADDVVFYSPVVFTPQKGKDITKLYLSAAGATFGVFGPGESSFHYTKEVVSGHHAVLEFEAEVEGVHINGVDIISFDRQGRMSEFKVMVRPLQAVNLLDRKMAEMLAQLGGPDA